MQLLGILQYQNVVSAKNTMLRYWQSTAEVQGSVDSGVTCKSIKSSRDYRPLYYSPGVHEENFLRSSKQSDRRLSDYENVR